MKESKGRNGGKLNSVEKGEVLNPKGRGKGVLNSSTRLKKLLELVKETKNPITGENEDFTVAELMDARLVTMVLNSKTKDVTVIAAYRELLDRLEGKAKQALTGGTDENGNDKPIEVNTSLPDWLRLKPKTDSE